MVDWNAGGGIRGRVAEVATANGCGCGEGAAAKPLSKRMVMTKKKGRHETRLFR
jgi:hypothetical protein